jgi:hypothetical protein
MVNRVTIGVALLVALLCPALPGLACYEWNSGCGPRPEKAWVEFLDQTSRFCFWYPPNYKRETASNRVDPSTDRQMLARLISREPRRAYPSDKQNATIKIYLLAGAFDLNRLVSDAPTGYDTPPIPKPYPENVFYYYGAGGGGVAYPDKYYFNLHGRALQIVFDGPYPGDDKSPNVQTQSVEKAILSSFKASPR